METELHLRIILEAPPPGVAYGLQKGKGSNFEVQQTQRSKKGADLLFEFPVRAIEDARKEPNLLGPYVQGPTGGRFVYINIGVYAGQADSPWSRRIKVPLQGITSAMLAAARDGKRVTLTARVRGTAADGSPSAATVKTQDGWKPD